MNKFILCKDEQTANELTNRGCILLQKNDDNFVFVNNLKLNFEDMSKKIIFTNRLNF